MRNKLVSLAVLFGLANVAPVNAGNITSDLLVYTSSQTSSYGPFANSTFGITSAGGFNASGASDLAQTGWFANHFGMYAETSLNSISESQGGFDTAYGVTQESILIPPQQGKAQGDPGVFLLAYHLDGTAKISVGITLDTTGQVVSFGRVHYSWGFFAGDVGMPQTSLGVTQQNTWLGNDITAVINQDIDVPIPFEFGVPFYYINEFRLEAGAGSSYGPSTGYAEGDFSHTGTLLGGTVFDQLRNPLSNPIVISDSGFDYLNPQAASVPEPATVLLLVGAGAPLLTRRSRKSAPHAFAAN